MDARNLVILTGRLVAEPVLRYLPSGAPVANFSIAVNRNSRNKDGSFTDTLEGFFDCELFDGVAITAAESLRKGQVIQVTGTLLQKRFESKAGEQVNKVEIRVRSIAPVLLAPKSETAAGNGHAKVAQPA